MDEECDFNPERQMLDTGLAILAIVAIVIVYLLV